MAAPGTVPCRAAGEEEGGGRHPGGTRPYGRNYGRNCGEGGRALPAQKAGGARDSAVQGPVPGVPHQPALCSPQCWRRTELTPLQSTMEVEEQNCSMASNSCDLTLYVGYIARWTPSSQGRYLRRVLGSSSGTGVQAGPLRRLVRRGRWTEGRRGRGPTWSAAGGNRPGEGI